jgi:hypothetical protein
MKYSLKALVVLAAAVAIVLRFVPLPIDNFSALGALAVLSGVVVRPIWLAIVVTLTARFISDSLLHYQTGYGFYGSMAFDYVAYALIVLAGRGMSPRSLPGSVGSGFVAAVVFFLVSNTGVWCMPLNGQYLYPQTVAGLMQCLAMGLPFAKGTICGDILMTTVYLAIAGTLVSWKTEEHPVAAE